jgi:hypothetical protein
VQRLRDFLANFRVLNLYKAPVHVTAALMASALLIFVFADCDNWADYLSAHATASAAIIAVMIAIWLEHRRDAEARQTQADARQTQLVNGGIAAATLLPTVLQLADHVHRCRSRPGVHPNAKYPGAVMAADWTERAKAATERYRRQANLMTSLPAATAMLASELLTNLTLLESAAHDAAGHDYKRVIDAQKGIPALAFELQLNVAYQDLQKLEAALYHQIRLARGDKITL